MDQAELDLRSLFQVLRRHLMLIVVLPITAALVAAVVSVFVLTPVYSASTTLWVVKEDAAPTNYNDLMLNVNLTKTYAEVAKSRAVLSGAIAKLGLKDLTYEQLAGNITVTPVRDTEILSFTIQDTDPRRAAALAGAVAESFQAQIRTFMKVQNVSIVDQAQVPLTPIKPRKSMNVAIAFVLGAMAAVGLAFLFEYLDTSVRSPEDVTARIGLPVLGVIPMIETQPAAPATRGRSSRRRRGAAK